MSVRVAIPVFYASLRLHLEKGRQWSIVEHILLHQVGLQASNAAKLATESDLPWRLVIEVMIRLMRVGWVELQMHKEETVFQITDAGRHVVAQETLPKVTRQLKRRASFAVDQVCGTVFRAREFPSLYDEQRLCKLKESTKVVVLPNGNKSHLNPGKVVQTLLEEDEECRGIDPSGAKPMLRYALVTVVGTTIDGFPSRKGAAKLRAAVLAAAAGSANQTESHQTHVDRSEETTESEQEMSIRFSSDDFILGGEQHKVTFERILSTARKRIIIHSTFIDQSKFRQHLPLIERAAQKGVRIDVLWGKSDSADGTNSTADAVTACRGMLISDIVRERVHIHGISTDSHSKLIIADNGNDGLVAVVGSCNWLSSSFESFEISAYLRAPMMVAEIAGKLSSMTMGASGLWSPLSRDLAALSTTAQSASQPKAGITVKSSLVMGAQHNTFMIRARDEAERTITIASHRMSPSAETLVLTPARAAVKAKDIAVKLYYGKVTGQDGGTAAVSLSRAAQVDGLKVNQILDPRLHAKFLAWDHDCVVITSQNWMSADPPYDKPYSEIGIFLKGPNLARDLVARVQTALERLPAF